MRTVRESARDVPVIADVDVLVIGSGPGGLGAAKAWRIGLMGASSTKRNVTLLLAALESILRDA